MDFQWLFGALRLGIILITIHFIGDFIFQIWMKKILEQKGIKYVKTDVRLLILHCMLYIPLFIPAFWFFAISFWWLAILFGFHFLIDRLMISSKNTVTYYPLARFLRDAVKYAIKKEVMNLKIAATKARFQIIDQVFHLALIIIIILVTV